MNQDIVWHKHTVTRDERSEMKGHKPALLWFTGLSGSGKSTIAGALETALAERRAHTYLLDGDNVRFGLCKDLGFSDEDRQENIRRIGEVAKLMVDAGLLVLSAFISPFEAEREGVKALFEEGTCLEVFVDTPLEICEQRDPKGLYKKARVGEIKSFTGIDSAYEVPRNPAIHLNTDQLTVTEAVELLLSTLEAKGIIPSNA